MVDTEYLRQHYSLLSDEALHEINRADLVVAAQRLYDEEILRRQGLHQEVSAVEEPEAAAGEQTGYDPVREDGKPTWIEEACEVYSAQAPPGVSNAPEVDQARGVLQAAGIPCYVDFLEEPGENPGDKATCRWRLLVPGEFNLRAASVIERDIFNDTAVEIWKNHLELLPDDDLRAALPSVVYCGLFDLVDRLVTAYDGELTRRGMK